MGEMEGVYTIFWKWFPTFLDPVAPIYSILDFYLSKIYKWKYLMKIDSPLSSDLPGNFKSKSLDWEVVNTSTATKYSFPVILKQSQ